MKAYKGFNADMTCRGFQYKEGESYQEDTADLCNSGFHACEDPIDCLKYYHPADGAVFHEVEIDDVSDRRENDTKICGKRICIGSRLDLGALIKAGVQFVFSKVDWESKKTIDFSTAASQGYSSKAASQGNFSKAASQGNFSTAEVNGEESIAAAFGRGVKARASKNSWIVLSDIDDNGHIVDIKSFLVDGEKVKANTWYRYKDGNLIEVG